MNLFIYIFIINKKYYYLFKKIFFYKYILKIKKNLF